MLLPEKIKSLDVSVGHAGRGQLLHSSRFEYRYLDIRADQPGQNPHRGLLRQGL